MAWLSLIIVTLVIFLPFVGMASTILEQDIVVQASILAMPMAVRIPYTGALRLLLYSIAGWLVLWGGVLLLERVLRTDFLVRLRLRNDLVYAFRPWVSEQIARRLAALTLGLAVIKMIGIPLLIIGAGAFIPWLEGWIGSQLAPEIASRILPILPRLVPLFNQWAQGLDGFNLSAPLVVFSLLVLVAERANGWEQRYRHNLYLRHSQLKRKLEQTAIVIPPTQRQVEFLY